MLANLDMKYFKNDTCLSYSLPYLFPEQIPLYVYSLFIQVTFYRMDCATHFQNCSVARLMSDTKPVDVIYFLKVMESSGFSLGIRRCSEFIAGENAA